METRYLTQVIYQGTTKIAQYGRFDGGPLYAGVELARWLAECDVPNDLALSRIADTTLHHQSQFGELVGDHIDDWELHHRELSHSTGMKIIDIVTQSGPCKLIDRTDFAASPFCKFHYVIDFDSHTVALNGSKPINFENWNYELMERINAIIVDCEHAGNCRWIDEINRIEFV